MLLSAVVFLLALVLLTGRSRALRQAMHDGLTRLPNRALVLDRAELMLARARRHDTPIAAMFIDVDAFKHVNDTFGHAAGDQFLQIIANRLSGVVREIDTVGRLGGDEFVVLVEGETMSAGAEIVAERLLAVLREPFELDNGLGRPQTCSASIGVAVGQRSTADELLRDADLALYQAKQAGKDRYVLFEESMQTNSADHIELETDLRDALANDELYLLYQPTFDLQTQSVTGVEALIRWAHPTRGDSRTRRVHPAGRGELNDHHDRPLGPSTSLPTGSRLARRGSLNRNVNQRVRPPTRARRVHRRGP